jgi:GT2 family glycosyltransferase
MKSREIAVQHRQQGNLGGRPTACYHCAMSDGESTQHRVTASLVVYHSDLTLLEQTLGSLSRAAHRLGTPVALTLVDNASDSTYRSQLRSLLQGLGTGGLLRTTLVESQRNAGYGGGHNSALADVGDYHLVLNPDVDLAPDALVAGVARLAADPAVVLLSPLATGSDGSREYLCKRYPAVMVLLLRAFAPALGWRVWPQKMTDYQMSDVCNDREEVQVPLASGCCMLIRGAALRQVGGFDERYFLYFEDFDLSQRLASLGQLLYFPGMRIVHHGGYAARKGWRHLDLFIRNGIRFFNQYGWRWF